MRCFDALRVDRTGLQRHPTPLAVVRDLEARSTMVRCAVVVS